MNLTYTYLGIVGKVFVLQLIKLVNINIMLCIADRLLMGCIYTSM